MKTCFASKVVMFKQCLAYQVVIMSCYNHQMEALANMIPWAQTWAIAKAICDTFFPIVTTCVLN